MDARAKTEPKDETMKLPRLYESSEDAAFDDDGALAETERRIESPEVTGIRSFFETVVRELERKSERPAAPVRRRA